MSHWKRRITGGWIVAQALATAVALTLVTGCDRAKRDESGAADPHRPSVILITIDAVRADRLGCYGHDTTQTTPIDELAATGVRFEQAYCTAPLTLASHASILTGCYPPTHGLQKDGRGTLAPNVATLAEAFRNHGYRTGAFVGSRTLDSSFGLDRGFEVYDDYIDSAGQQPWLRQYRSAADVNEAALRWLNQIPRQPFLLWVQFADPAFAYTIPASTTAEAVAAYEATIASVARKVAQLKAWLRKHGRDGNTLIVVAGSCGEALGEHGEVGHGLFLYDSTIRVPLILSMPPRVAATTHSAPVSLVDIAPMIFDCLDWPPASSADGTSRLTGDSSGAEEPPPVYAETMYPRASIGAAALRCIINPQWKYIHAPKPELYDRAADPKETNNVVAEHPDVALALDAELEAMPARPDERNAAAFAADLPPDPKDRLAVYQAAIVGQRLNERRAYDKAIAVLEPVAAQAPDAAAVRAALGDAYLRLERYEDAVREYDAALLAQPDDPLLLCRAGDALLGQGNTEAARNRFEQATKDAPGYLPAHNRLGALHFRAERYEEAVACLRRCLAIAPQSPRILTNLASALPHVGGHGEAVKRLQEALVIDPTYGPAHSLLYQVWVATGRNEDAIAALRTARAALPDHVEFKRELARLLATTPPTSHQAAVEAIKLATECCQVEPDVPDNHEALAIAYEAVGNFARAADAARTALQRAEEQGNEALSESLRGRLDAYQKGRRP